MLNASDSIIILSKYIALVPPFLSISSKFVVQVEVSSVLALQDYSTKYFYTSPYIIWKLYEIFDTIF